ncbi:MAG: hypothetical protein AAGI22_29655, partial [Planctomycetota bacterium]
ARPARPGGTNAAEAPSSGSFSLEPAKPARPARPGGTNAAEAPSAGTFYLRDAETTPETTDVAALLREIEVMERRLAELRAELDDLKAAIKRSRRR